jgi:hypothetical protein
MPWCVHTSIHPSTSTVHNDTAQRFIQGPSRCWSNNFVIIMSSRETIQNLQSKIMQVFHLPFYVSFIWNTTWCTHYKVYVSYCYCMMAQLRAVTAVSSEYVICLLVSYGARNTNAPSAERYAANTWISTAVFEHMWAWSDVARSTGRFVLSIGWSG